MGQKRKNTESCAGPCIRETTQPPYDAHSSCSFLITGGLLTNSFPNSGWHNVSVNISHTYEWNGLDYPAVLQVHAPISGQQDSEKTILLWQVSGVSLVIFYQPLDVSRSFSRSKLNSCAAELYETVI